MAVEIRVGTGKRIVLFLSQKLLDSMLHQIRHIECVEWRIHNREIVPAPVTFLVAAMPAAYMHMVPRWFEFLRAALRAPGRSIG